MYFLKRRKKNAVGARDSRKEPEEKRVVVSLCCFSVDTPPSRVRIFVARRHVSTTPPSPRCRSA